LKFKVADVLEVKNLGFLTGHLWEQITLQAYVRRKTVILFYLYYSVSLS